MKKILTGISQIIVFAVVHSWTLGKCLHYSTEISIGIKESEFIRYTYGHPVVAAVILLVIFPVLQGMVPGFVIWLIYNNIGIEKITLLIMIVYLIAFFFLIPMRNIDYSSEDAAGIVFMHVENYILTGMVFVCSVLPITEYDGRFKGFLDKVSEYL